MVFLIRSNIAKDKFHGEHECSKLLPDEIAGFLFQKYRFLDAPFRHCCWYSPYQLPITLHNLLILRTLIYKYVFCTY